MQRIRYIKLLLVVGVIAALGLCAMLLIAQAGSQTPSSGARLILEQKEILTPCV